MNCCHDLGYEDLFRRALLPLRRFIHVLQTSRDLVPGQPLAIWSPVDRAPLREAVGLTADPLQPEDWHRDFSRCAWDGGHTFKFPYAFYDHARRVTPELANAARANFMKILGGS